MRRCLSTGALRILAILIIAVSLGSCSSGERKDDGKRFQGMDKGVLSVYTVNYPLQYFAERIAGENAVVTFRAPTGIDPAHWSPEPEQISEYQTADVIFLNGAHYARWVDHASLPPSKLVNTTALAEARLLKVEGAVAHRHGPEGEHTHGETAFTTWLDPTLALEQARVIAQTLSEHQPAKKREFQAGFQALESDLRALDESWQEAFSSISRLPILASHPVYQYLARRYQLSLEAVELEPGEFPDERSWRELEAILERHPATTMLWEDVPLAETTTRLAQLGIKTVVFRPSGNRPPEGDFLTVMRENGENVRAIR